MKSQKQKMFDGEPYDAHSEEMVTIRKETKKLLHRYNVTEYYSDNSKAILNQLCPNAAKNIHFEPPFHCDYGDHIFAEEGVFINFGGVILDGAKVSIGRRTMLAPGVHIYTAQHPLDADERDIWEDCKPVTIGERCWIGGHVTICPGVTIGDRVVIGAGSVVTRDIPSDSLAVGNPARVIRKLNGTENQAELAG